MKNFQKLILASCLAMSMINVHGSDKSELSIDTTCANNEFSNPPISSITTASSSATPPTASSNNMSPEDKDAATLDMPATDTANALDHKAQQQILIDSSNCNPINTDKKSTMTHDADYSKDGMKLVNMQKFGMQWVFANTTNKELADKIVELNESLRRKQPTWITPAYKKAGQLVSWLGSHSSENCEDDDKAMREKYIMSGSSGSDYSDIQKENMFSQETLTTTYNSLPRIMQAGCDIVYNVNERLQGRK